MGQFNLAVILARISYRKPQSFLKNNEHLAYIEHRPFTTCERHTTLKCHLTCTRKKNHYWCPTAGKLLTFMYIIAIFWNGVRNTRLRMGNKRLVSGAHTNSCSAGEKVSHHLHPNAQRSKELS